MEYEEIKETVGKVLAPYPKLDYSVAVDPIYLQVKIKVLNRVTKKCAEYLVGLAQQETEIVEFLAAAVKELNQE